MWPMIRCSRSSGVCAEHFAAAVGVSAVKVGGKRAYQLVRRSRGGARGANGAN